ncbi:MAG: iron-sulfur cluster insertion protein ErpA [Verrucomicrobiales bacterium]|nr:iron-sulfur cluster insertion protein ErpA [Verrucomicrobiales bacterium]
MEASLTPPEVSASLNWDMNMTSELTDVVSVTESAATQIKSMMENDAESKGKFLRVYVEAGGCSGMQYGMTFDEKRADDLASEISGVTVLVDSFSSNYLRGSVVDYVDSLTGGGFKISNPNAKQSCGCGKSFEA